MILIQNWIDQTFAFACCGVCIMLTVIFRKAGTKTTAAEKWRRWLLVMERPERCYESSLLWPGFPDLWLWSMDKGRCLFEVCILCWPSVPHMLPFIYHWHILWKTRSPNSVLSFYPVSSPFLDRELISYHYSSCCCSSSWGELFKKA